MSRKEALATADKYGLRNEVERSYQSCGSWEEALAEWDIL